MNFPEMTDIEKVKEQLELYQLPLKPNDRNALLVSGPPGTGKTVVALYRAQKILIEAPGASVKMVMFNNTLTRYCENCVNKVKEAVKRQTREDVGARFTVDTWDNWFGDWVSDCKKSGIDTDDFYKFEEYERKGEIKKKKVYQWDTICREVHKALRKGDELPRWNHLIVDEAQDFHEGFHKLAGIMTQQRACDGLMILADENQQITDENSTIESISRKIFRCPDFVKEDAEHHHLLKKNFRNSRPIARVAREFFSGGDTLFPELPDRRGNMPEILERNTSREQVDTLCTEVKNLATRAPEQKIGVVVDWANQIEMVFGKLEDELPGRSISYYKYVNDYRTRKRLQEALEFDKSGAITVLTAQSVKGLEFDAVICLRTWKEVDDPQYQKQSYVLFARAREQLIIISKTGNGFRQRLLSPRNQQGDTSPLVVER